MWYPSLPTPFELIKGCLYHKGRMVLLAKSNWRKTLLQECYHTPTRGYYGAYRTYRRLADNVYWIGMKGDVHRLVAKCSICQKQKYQTTSLAGLLQPLPIPNMIGEDIVMNFITRLLKSKGVNAILVVVDRLSKYGHFWRLDILCQQVL